MLPWRGQSILLGSLSKEPRYKTTIEITLIAKLSWSKAIKYIPPSKQACLKTAGWTEVPWTTLNQLANLGSQYLLPYSQKKDSKRAVAALGLLELSKHIVVFIICGISTRLPQSIHFVWAERFIQMNCKWITNPLEEFYPQSWLPKKFHCQLSTILILYLNWKNMEKINQREFGSKIKRDCHQILKWLMGG